MNEIKIVIEGMKELTEAVNKLAASMTGSAPMSGNPSTMADTPNPGFMNQPTPAPVVQTSVPVQQPIPSMQPTAANQMPGMAPVQSTVPTTAVPQAFTLEQLQVAAAGLTGMGKMPQVMGILQRFGIQAMTELPKERYGEFALSLREAGAQI